MTKPAKEGFDADDLVIDRSKPEGDDERDTGRDEDDAPEGDEFDDDDKLSLDELTEKLQRSIAAELAEEDAPAAGDDEDDDDPNADVETRLKKAEAELKTMKAERKARMEREAKKEAGREVIATVKEFKLSRPQLERVVRWYVKNPDMEGVVPFREGAIRVLGLGDRVDGGDSGGRNGDSPRDRRAHVITRGGGGPAPRKETFKIAPTQGDYSSITQHLLKNPNVLRGVLR